ncbi:MAG: MBL fold metallo-hydrolase, partial [Methanothrix sp.]|nr:MBL fold metallo-hydrolase [Methanothrix sp.]
MKMYLKTILAVAIALIAVLPGAFAGENSSAGSFQGSSIRNAATDYTIAANLKANDTPAWINNEEDLDFAARGFLATDDPLIIPSD